MPKVLIDSYPESNANNGLYLYNSSFTGVAQTFTAPEPFRPYSIKFYGGKVGLPPGNLNASIYNFSGSAGSTAKPIGSALCSTSVAASSIPNTDTVFEILINNGSVLPAGSYMAAIEYSAGDNVNFLNIGTRYIGTDPGNLAVKVLSTWVESPDEDMIFYVYGINGRIKYFNGVSYVAKPIKVNNGSPWEEATLKQFNGNSWIATNY